ncbi:radical SAM protein [Propionicimonas sp.]|uniref:radical SAM protein n=1 Tax=Propionicimonas sp. TaxID=1955623 RepID=UPI003A5216BC
MSIPCVFNIQRFCVHDGPGLRTTIFFKGCPLQCPWCHNPESQSFDPEPMPDASGRIEQVGRRYPLDELVAEAASDVLFFDQSGGGVTFSGGEVMAMPEFDYVLELARRLRAKGISLGIDTCGVAATTRFEQLAPFADFWLYDLKFLDSVAHRAWTGASNRLVLRNLETLAGLGATIDLRMILLDGLNADPATVERTLDWLAAHDVRPRRLHLLPYHRLGSDKQARLGRPAQQFVSPSDATMAGLKELAERYVEDVVVGG